MKQVRTCPFCDSENTEIEEESYDFFEDELHIMYDMKCNDCGEGFIGEDDYVLKASGTGANPDDLLMTLEEE